MNKGDTVSLELSAEEIALKDQLEQNERVLASYENDLRAIDAELEQHLEKNHQYDVLSRICRSFEELDELGAANLFWDEQQHPENLDQRLRHAHRKIDEFGAEITALEKRRDSIIDEIYDQNLALDCLHYDLLDVTEREAGRKREWLVEREIEELPYRKQIMNGLSNAKSKNCRIENRSCPGPGDVRKINDFGVRWLRRYYCVS
jgi:hypothetical protein